MRFRFVGRDNQLGEAGARTTRHQPDIVGNLVQRDRQRAQGTRKLYQGIVSALYCEFVWCTPKRQERCVPPRARGNRSGNGHKCRSGFRRSSFGRNREADEPRVATSR
jgi:hypothetical protein